MAQEGRPAGLVLLGGLADAEDLARTLAGDAGGHQQRDVARLAGPGALHGDAVEETQGCAPSIGRPRQAAILAEIFPLRLETVLGLTRAPRSAPVMSSTQRTETPARDLDQRLLERSPGAGGAR